MKKLFYSLLTVGCLGLTGYAAVGPGSGTNRLYFNYTGAADANYIELASDRDTNMGRITFSRLGATKPIYPIALEGAGVRVYPCTGTGVDLFSVYSTNRSGTWFRVESNGNTYAYVLSGATGWSDSSGNVLFNDNDVVRGTTNIIYNINDGSLLFATGSALELGCLPGPTNTVFFSYDGGSWNHLVTNHANFLYYIETEPGPGAGLHVAPFLYLGKTNHVYATNRVVLEGSSDGVSGRLTLHDADLIDDSPIELVFGGAIGAGAYPKFQSDVVGHVGYVHLTADDDSWLYSLQALNFRCFPQATPNPLSGEISYDSNAWSGTSGALKSDDGVSNTVIVAVLELDPPSPGQVPKWNASGQITWEDDAGTVPGIISDGEATNSLATTVPLTINITPGITTNAFQVEINGVWDPGFWINGAGYAYMDGATLWNAIFNSSIFRDTIAATSNSWDKTLSPIVTLTTSSNTTVVTPWDYPEIWGSLVVSNSAATNVTITFDPDGATAVYDSRTGNSAATYEFDLPAGTSAWIETQVSPSTAMQRIINTRMPIEQFNQIDVVGSTGGQISYGLWTNTLPEIEGTTNAYRIDFSHHDQRIDMTNHAFLMFSTNTEAGFGKNVSLLIVPDGNYNLHITNAWYGNIGVTNVFATNRVRVGLWSDGVEVHYGLSVLNKQP